MSQAFKAKCKVQKAKCKVTDTHPKRFGVRSSASCILRSPVSSLQSPVPSLHSPFSLLPSPFCVLQSLVSSLQSPFSIPHSAFRNRRRPASSRHQHSLFLTSFTAPVAAALLASGLPASAQTALPDTSRPSGYALTYTTYRDVSTLDQSLNYARLSWPHLSLYAGSSFSDAKNTTLARTQGERNAHINADYSLPHRITLGLSARGSETSDRGAAYKSKSLRDGLALNLTYVPWENVTLSRSEGLLFDRYQRTEAGPLNPGVPVTLDRLNQGHSDASGIMWRPFPGSDSTGVDLPLLLSYSESGQSQQSSSSRNRSFSSTLTMPAGPGTLQAQGDVSRFLQTYPYQNARESKSLGQQRAHLVYEPMKAHGVFRSQLTLDLSRVDSRYSSTDPALASSLKDNQIEDATLGSTIDYAPHPRVSVGVQFKRTGKKSRYGQTVNNEDFLFNDLRTTVTWRLPAGNQLAFLRAIRLSRYDLLHPFNFDTRDMLEEETSSTLSVNVFPRTRLVTLLAARQNHLIYVQREKSANNRRMTSYEFSPALDLHPFDFLSLRESFGLRADYIIYDFSFARGTLLRTKVIATRIEILRRGREAARLEYTHNTLDQGGYLLDPVLSAWGYRRDTGRDQDNFEILVPVSLGPSITLDPRYALQRIERWQFHPDTSGTRIERSPTSRLLQQDFSVGVSTLIGEDASLRASLARTYREGERSFWDIKSTFTYGF